jgi:hypothetical protein
LANLAKSDTENRVEKIINEYLEHLEDEKFINSKIVHPKRLENCCSQQDLPRKE